MGEPVYQFIRRLRLEKSADLLLTKPETPITEIAMVCGFAASSSFAKSFKEHFHMRATAWRKRSNASFDKESQPMRVEVGAIYLRPDKSGFSGHDRFHSCLVPVFRGVAVNRHS